MIGPHKVDVEKAIEQIRAARARISQRTKAHKILTDAMYSLGAFCPLRGIAELNGIFKEPYKR